jgi:heat shock protein 1/8
VLRIINEPTAAALAYGLDKTSTRSGEGQMVLVFDLGGGTFDVSVLSIENGVFTVLATGGDTRLGGEDFDNAVLDHLLLEAEKQGLGAPEEFKKDARALQRVRKAAEAAKRELSNANSAEIRLDSLVGNKNFKNKLTRAKFELLNRARFNMCIETVQRVLKDAKLKQTDMDDIVLVGGSTRIPMIQKELATYFNKTVDDLCKSVNPDEAVAYGAAVQGAILNGSRNAKTDNLLLMDVTPLSLGIETTGRVMSVIIPRNTPIPCSKTQVYTTEQNYQTKVDVSVYEGERLKSDENNLLGEFTISGIESAKRGEPQIDVTFSLDSDGCLNVTAKDQKTGAEAKISIANRSKMSSEEIDRMVKEAERFKKEDAERIKKMEAKNELEATIFQVLDIAQEIDDRKMAGILEEAAHKDQLWMEEFGEAAKAAELAMRRRNLARRIDRYQNN